MMTMSDRTYCVVIYLPDGKVAALCADYGFTLTREEAEDLKHKLNEDFMLEEIKVEYVLGHIRMPHVCGQSYENFIRNRMWRLKNGKNNI